MDMLKPFKELIRLTQDGKDELLAGVRERAFKAKVDLKLAGIDEKLIGIEQDMNEELTKKEPDLDRIYCLINKAELAEREAAKFREIVAQLFPTASTE